MSVLSLRETASVPAIQAIMLTVYASVNGIPTRASSNAVRTSVKAATETSTNAFPRAIHGVFFLPFIHALPKHPKTFSFYHK